MFQGDHTDIQSRGHDDDGRYPSSLEGAEQDKANA